MYKEPHIYDESGNAILTPRLNEDPSSRMEMSISKEDMAVLDSAGRGPGYKGRITDLITGKLWDIHGAPCTATNPDGSGCYCDALATEVPH